MNKKTEAHCQGQMLTVAFNGAEPPLIWRFDLERNHSFTLALQGEEGEWELGVTSPKGDFYPVAHFAAREDAEDAFAKVGKALSYRKEAASAVVRALKTLALIAGLIFLGVAGFAFYVAHVTSKSTSITPLTNSAPSTLQGVPLPADEVLQPPR